MYFAPKLPIMQDTATEIIKDTTPFFTNDTIVFGILMIALGFIFYTSSREDGFWKKFYGVVPALFMAYFLPALLTTSGVISPEWTTISETGETTTGKSSLYYMSSKVFITCSLSINDIKY